MTEEVTKEVPDLLVLASALQLALDSYDRLLRGYETATSDPDALVAQSVLDAWLAGRRFSLPAGFSSVLSEAVGDSPQPAAD